MTDPSAQNPQKVAKEQAEADKAAAEARLAEANSQAKIALATQFASAELQAKRAAGEKAEQDAKAAKIAADQKAQEASGGTQLEELAKNFPTASVKSGAVTAADSAGKIEADVLAVRATKVLGDEIAKSIAGYAPDGFVLWTSDDPPSFSRAEAYEVNFKRLEELFKDALETYQNLAMPGANQLAKVSAYGAFATGSAVAKAITGAATIADKAASFLQITYSYAGLATTGSDGDLLARATAASLRRYGAPVYDPRYASTRSAFEDIKGKVEKLAGMDEDASKHLLHCDAEIARLNKAIASAVAAASEPPPGDQGDDATGDLGEQKAAWIGAKSRIEAAQKGFDELLTMLAAKDDGQVMASAIAHEMALRDLIKRQKRFFLQLKVHASGGTSESRQSIWSFLPFFQPFRISGGVVASFQVFDPDTGQIMMADSLEAHSGFHGIKTLRRSAGHRETAIRRRRHPRESELLLDSPDESPVPRIEAPEMPTP